MVETASLIYLFPHLKVFSTSFYQEKLQFGISGDFWLVFLDIEIENVTSKNNIGVEQEILFCDKFGLERQTLIQSLFYLFIICFYFT